ncbi:class D sortase [Bacillus alveayuensis]|jgi:sortase A|uniref:class D sortase n=1 Tax=Aeribacillus alveayuensis TaxID=279215 RepID=UPI0005D11686|nr:class D sortase [Bacillus alveayuensis]
MKWLSWTMIVTGIVIMVFGVSKIIHTHYLTNKSMEEAKKFVEEKNSHESQIELFMPNEGEAVGILKIPRLQAELPIIEGTDPDDLEKGVGHYKGSFYPDENGQIVLSGHRDTVFRKIGELKIGDELIIELPYGTFSYKMMDTKIVDADDTSIITLQNEYEELIVTTCYPFSYVGNAPERYIIYAKRNA